MPRQIPSWPWWLLAYTLAHLPRLFVGPIGVDLPIYRHAAELAFGGQALAVYAPGGKFIYTPLALFLMEPLAWVSPRTGYMIMGLLNWASLFAVCAILIRRLNLDRGRAILVTVLTMATVGRYVGHTVNIGQINVVLVLLLLLALTAAFDGHTKTASTFYLLCVCFKLTPLAFIAYLLLKRRLPVVVLSVVGLVVLNGLAALTLSGNKAVALFAAYANQIAVFSAPGHPMNVSLLSLTAYRPEWRWPLIAALALIFVLFHADMARRKGRPETGEDTTFAHHARWWGWVMVFMLVASPVTWFTHFVWLVPPVVTALGVLLRVRFFALGWMVFGAAAFHAWGLVHRVLGEGYPEDIMLTVLILLLATLVSLRASEFDRRPRANS